MSSPYRTASPPRDSQPPPPPNPHPDRDLLPVFALIWVVSLAHVASALHRHASFGTEDTLALISIFLLPALVKGPLRNIARGNTK